MSFLQAAVVAKYLKQQDKQVIDTAYQKFTHHFHNPQIQSNIRHSKEEQYQEGFLRDLFVNILGYKLNPDTDFNLTTELKNVKDAKKADGGILVGGKVLGVIELKGCDTTDLAKIETQAFGYKNNQPDCIYVITANFEKIRLYIDNAIEHIEWNLFSLSAQDFARFYLLLAYPNIAKGIAQKIKTESLSQEEAITKQLYADYAAFKRELFASITQLNPTHNKLALFKKTQKLLDRFLFLFFAEDKGLLPPNSVSVVLTNWRKLQDMDTGIALYDRFKKYFGYLNTGFKGKYHDVFAYNGGLFKPDNLLDSIVIDDEVLFTHAQTLANYDFASEVDVNILGHIFENSLNELDEIKSQLAGAVIDKSQTKRKKDGVFYTPKYITQYIVENTLGKLCTEKKQELKIIDAEYATDKKITKKKQQAALDKLMEYRNWLLELTICDPACGSGAFLNQALSFLIDEHGYLDELEAKITGGSLIFKSIENSILENNLYGVDINEESVEIAKLSLWLRTAKPQRKLTSLSSNIKCGNSLIDDPQVTENAFNWQAEFPQVFAKGGFDVVIGNPPYVRQELVKQYSNYFSKTFKSYSGKADLFIYFYERALDLVKHNGVVSFISSGKFFEASYGKPLIKILIENSQIIEIIDFKDLNVFDGISAYPLILTFKKKIIDEEYIFNYKDATKIKVNNLNETVQNIDFEKISKKDFIENDYKFLNYSISKVISKVENNSIRLENLKLLPLVGIKTGFNKGFIISDTKFSKDYIFGRDIKRYSTLISDNKIFFPYTFENEKYTLIDENTSELTTLTEKEKLKGRAIIKEGIVNGTKKWYEFQQINKKLNFDNEYIVYPNVSLGSNFTLSKGNIIDMTGFIIPSNSKYLLCVLNSKLVVFLMELYAISRRGGYLEYKTQYILKLPIKDISQENQQPFIDAADTMLTLNQNLQEFTSKFTRSLQRKFESLAKLPKALQTWYNLDYKEFTGQLAKKKIKLSLSQEAEWEEYFLAEQAKALALKNQIDTTDKKIDHMVYELYGLTADEIKIVEDSTQ